MPLSGNVLLSGVMLAVFAGMTVLALDYPPDSRLLPLVVGIPGTLLCAAQLAYELVVAARARPRGGGRAGAGGRRRATREPVLLAWFVAFVVGVLAFGFVYGGTALVFAFLYVDQRERATVAAATALGFLAFLHLVFGQLLRLRLFDGLLVERVLG